MIILNEKKKIKRIGSFLTWKIDVESQNFDIFDNFYSTQDLNGLVVGFGPKGRPERMCDSVHFK